MSLAQNLWLARVAAGLSHEHVADAIGIPLFELFDVERGQRAVSAMELKTFADLFGVTADELLRDRVMTDDDREVGGG